MLKNYKWLKMLVLSLTLLGSRSEIIAFQLLTTIPVVACAGSVIQSKCEPVRLLRNVGTSLAVGSLYKEDLIGGRAAVSILLGAGLLYSHYDGLINLFSAKDKALGAIKTSGRAIQEFATNYPTVTAAMTGGIVFGSHCYINKMSPIEMLKMYGLKNVGLGVSTFFNVHQIFQSVRLRGQVENAQTAREELKGVITAVRTEAERNAQVAQIKIVKLNERLKQYKEDGELLFYRMQVLRRVDDVAALAEEEARLCKERKSLCEQVRYLHGQREYLHGQIATLRGTYQNSDVRIIVLEAQLRAYEARNRELYQRLYPHLTAEERAGMEAPQENVQQQADGGVVQQSITTNENEERARGLQELKENLKKEMATFQELKQILGEVGMASLKKAGETNPVMRVIDGAYRLLIGKINKIKQDLSLVDDADSTKKIQAIKNLKQELSCTICGESNFSTSQISSHRSAVYGCKRCCVLYCPVCIIEALCAGNGKSCPTCRVGNDSGDWYGLWSLDVSPTVKGLVDRESKYLECFQKSVARLCREANSKECMDDRKFFLMSMRDKLKKEKEEAEKASEKLSGDDLQEGNADGAGPAESPSPSPSTSSSDQNDLEDDE